MTFCRVPSFCEWLCIFGRSFLFPLLVSVCELPWYGALAQGSYFIRGHPSPSSSSFFVYFIWFVIALCLAKFGYYISIVSLRYQAINACQRRTITKSRASTERNVFGRAGNRVAAFYSVLLPSLFFNHQTRNKALLVRVVRRCVIVEVGRRSCVSFFFLASALHRVRPKSTNFSTSGAVTTYNINFRA